MSNPGQLESSPQKRPSRWRLWPLWLSGFILFLLLASILLPPVNGSHDAPRVKSANNLKQIGLALQMYANDNGGRYPDTLGVLLETEDITPAVFVSPGSKDTPADGPTTQALLADLTAGGHLSYIYLVRGLTTQPSDDVILAYENPAIWPTGANILFGDGHVEFDDPKFVRQMTDKAAAGVFPVTMPSVGN
jgi:prepilin-type processing-associated H-X9-DG protein